MIFNDLCEARILFIVAATGAEKSEHAAMYPYVYTYNIPTINNARTTIIIIFMEVGTPIYSRRMTDVRNEFWRARKI